MLPAEARVASLLPVTTGHFLESGLNSTTSPIHPTSTKAPKPRNIITNSSVSAWGATPNTLEIPSLSRSKSTSPASSALSTTSLGIKGSSAKIHGHDSSPNFAIRTISILQSPQFDIASVVHYIIPLSAYLLISIHPFRVPFDFVEVVQLIY